MVNSKTLTATSAQSAAGSSNDVFITPATLRAGPWDRFVSVALPLARPGLLTGAVLGFAHTVGEFGVVLMIGGNIPGETRVLSVAIFEHVEAAEFEQAHRLAAGMVVFALLVLVTLYRVNRPARDTVGATVGDTR